MFIPSEKQLIALSNMERFNWILSNRTNFENLWDFQNYFEILSKKSKKKSLLLNNLKDWKVTKEELRKSISSKKNYYYWNEHILKNYAIEYIDRYSPSKNQLRDQLQKKTNNKDTINKVFMDVEKLINEDIMINSLLEQLKLRWKNLSFISQKLYNKKFDWELIKKYIENLKKWWSLIQEYTLEEKIVFYQKKWMSRNAIYMKFYERGEDRVVLNSFLEKYFDVDLEKQSLENMIACFKEKGLETKKIISRLLARWFKYWDIKDSL